MIQNALTTTEQAKPVTVIALRNQARELGIKGFMRMKKAELQKAIHDFLDTQKENTVCEHEAETQQEEQQDKNILVNIERKRLYAIEAGKANISEIVQFSREYSHDILKFNYGVQSMQNILHSGIRLFYPFYAEREILKGMAAQLGIFRRWDEKECYCNDDVLRDLIIQKLQSLSVRIQNQQELKPKLLNNEYRNGAWENALQENLELIKSCKTRSELTLLLRSFEGSTLAQIFRHHHLIPYPYGGGGINDSLTIRDFVEYEFQKREGKDVRTMQPDLLIKALPAHASSPIEKIAHDDLNEGIQQEKQRVIEFALALRDTTDYQNTIQQFDSVRYMNNTVDGFIDTFRMIFDAYDDNHNSENPIVRCEHDSDFRRHVKEQIIFWGRQWAKQDRFSQLKSGKIRQQLQLARLDTWNEIIDDFDSSDVHDDDNVIDVEFFEVTQNTHDDNLIQLTENNAINDETHDVTTPVAGDEWRKTAAKLNLKSCFDDIRKFTRSVNRNKKINRRKMYNPPLRKSVLLPGQITIPFEKPYRDIH